MSSFKSYGKIDESEKAKLEARRKTWKRIAIISFSSIILVGVVVAAVLGTAANDSHDNSGNGNNDQSAVSTSVKAVCDATLYKESCYSSLGHFVPSGQVQPEELFKLSIEVALNEVSKAIQYLSQKGVFEGVADKKTTAALENCGELLGLAADHLNNSLNSVENSSLLGVFEDLQTWLSSAGTILMHLYILCVNLHK